MTISEEYLVISGEDSAAVLPLRDVTDIFFGLAVTVVWCGSVEHHGTEVRLFGNLADAIKFAQTNGESE